jgi:hypothetical protein
MQNRRATTRIFRPPPNSVRGRTKWERDSLPLTKCGKVYRSGGERQEQPQHLSQRSAPRADEASKKGPEGIKMAAWRRISMQPSGGGNAELVIRLRSRSSRIAHTTSLTNPKNAGPYLTLVMTYSLAIMPEQRSCHARARIVRKQERATVRVANRPDAGKTAVFRKAGVTVNVAMLWGASIPGVNWMMREAAAGPWLPIGWAGEGSGGIGTQPRSKS